jgi:dTMP kinase
VAGVRPELTILIDVPAELGLARVQERAKTDTSGGPDRFEGEALRVHEGRRKRFLDLAAEEAYRFAVIDGSKDLEAVSASIQSAVEAAFQDQLTTDTPAQEAD